VDEEENYSGSSDYIVTNRPDLRKTEDRVRQMRKVDQAYGYGAKEI
jgi:hypothetical protein